MDYVREELLRQQKALEMLLSGAASEPEREEAAAEATSGAWRTEREKPVAGRVPEANAESRRIHRMIRTESVSEGWMGSMVEEAEWLRKQNPSNGAVAAGTEETNVRAVSRAVQRDARRYDGGFSIY